MFYGLKINDKPYPRVFPLDADTLMALIDGDETKLRLPCGLTLPALDQAQEARMREHDEGMLTDEEYEQKLNINKKNRPYICTCDFEGDRRVGEKARWAGFVAHDFDHIGASLSEERGVRSEECPAYIYEQRIKGHEREWGIVGVFISPSRHGLKIISRIGRHDDIAQAQQAMARLVGLECDKHTKDIARATYLVSRERWLYLDQEGMFTKTPEEFSFSEECGVRSEERGASLSEERGVRSEELNVSSSATPNSKTNNSSLLTPNSSLKNNSSSLINKYKGIVAEWWEQHGIPELGSRHAAIYSLAYNLKYICENDPQMTFEAIKTCDTFGKPDDEVLAICKDVCSKRGDHLYMPKELKKVVDSLESSEECEASLSEELLSEECGVRSEELNTSSSATPNGAANSKLKIQNSKFKTLPIGIKDSLENLSPEMQMPMLAALLPLMAAYADGVKARYADGKMHPLALMSIVLGEMASGKSNCRDIVDVWLEKMREDDAEQRRVEEEWKQQNKGRKANEKAKPDPEVTIREVPITISCSTLLKRLKNSKAHTLYSFEEELDTLRKTNSAGNWSAKYDIYRKAFDNSTWGQDYNSDQATSGIARVAYNWSILGTYGSFRKCFKGESVENGLASRIIIAEMPDNRFAKLTQQKLLTQEQ